MNNSKTRNSPPEPEPTQDLSNLDRVRDILFGQQARDLEKRLEVIEARHNQNLAALRNEMLERLEAMEGFAREERKSLEASIANETGARIELGERLNRQLEQERVDFEKRIAALTQNFSQAEAGLRQALLEQGKRNSEELRNAQENNRVALERETSRLQHDKLSRSALAGLLAEVAMRLSDDANTSN